MTGSSLFEGIRVEALTNILLACLVASGGAAGLALSRKAHKHVSDILTSGCKVFVNGAVDKIIDGLFFEEPFVVNADNS